MKVCTYKETLVETELVQLLHTSNGHNHELCIKKVKPKCLDCHLLAGWRVNPTSSLLVDRTWTNTKKVREHSEYIRDFWLQFWKEGGSGDASSISINSSCRHKIIIIFRQSWGVHCYSVICRGTLLWRHLLSLWRRTLSISSLPHC